MGDGERATLGLTGDRRLVGDGLTAPFACGTVAAHPVVSLRANRCARPSPVAGARDQATQAQEPTRAKSNLPWAARGQWAETWDRPRPRVPYRVLACPSPLHCPRSLSLSPPPPPLPAPHPHPSRSASSAFPFDELQVPSSFVLPLQFVPSCLRCTRRRPARHASSSTHRLLFSAECS